MTTLDPPRWLGGPPICVKTNLPALPTEDALHEFHRRNGPRCAVLREWQCDACGHWHAATVAPDPSGSTSGTGRTHKHYHA